MLIDIVKTETITIKPGDEVRIDTRVKPVTIVKVVENRDRLYAVLSNSTWRPFSTYGVTWLKVEDEE